MAQRLLPPDRGNIDLSHRCSVCRVLVGGWDEVGIFGVCEKRVLIAPSLGQFHRMKTMGKLWENYGKTMMNQQILPFFPIVFREIPSSVDTSRK